VADINAANAAAVAREVEGLGRRSAALTTDVSDEASCQALAQAVQDRFGRIDVLVNNAAIFHGLDRQDQSLAYFNKILSVNLTGVWLMTRAVERVMKRQRRGKIINQSSTAAYITNMGFADTSDPDRPSPPFHYSLAKLGVRGLTKFFAGALGPWGINVNAICPGVTMTEATKAVVPPEILKTIVGASALKRALEPEDLTGTAVFLASEDSDLMTGRAGRRRSGSMLGIEVAPNGRTSPRARRHGERVLEIKGNGVWKLIPDGLCVPGLLLNLRASVVKAPHGAKLHVAEWRAETGSVVSE
jgi:3-oxoacyl-[acyl-carrier protein] reductase